MLRVSGNNKINTSSLRTGDHDGVFIIIVFEAECILTIFTQCIDDSKECKNAGNDLSSFFINVFLAFELFSGKEMNICYFFGRNESVNLFRCNGKEDFFSIIKPRASFLKNVQYDICIKQNSHDSLRRSSRVSSHVVVWGRAPKSDSAISTLF